MKNFTHKTWINFIFGGALFILAISNLLNYNQLQQLLSANNWVIHTYQVIEKINDAMLATVDSERLERAYLASGDKTTLQNFKRDTQETLASVDSIKKLTIKNMAQQKRITQIEAAIRKHIHLSQNIIAIAQNEGREAALKAEKMTTGKDHIEPIKNLVLEMTAAEVDLLQARNEQALYHNRKSHIMTISVSCLSAVLLLLSFYLLNHQITLRQKDALALKKANDTLHFLSVRDPLTGLYNRRYLQETLQRETLSSLRKKTSLAIIMADIDHFKRFNDTYGHDTGDSVLKNIGKLFQEHVRGSDVVCRYGGEEFIIVLYDTHLEAAKQFAERVRENMRRISIQYGNSTLGSITLSQGIAVFPSHGITPKTLIESADRALYMAKERGRDRVICANEEVIKAENTLM